MLFAIQPVVTVSMVIASMLLYKVPIGKGFGMVAVLASVDSSSLDVLKGAGFSGQLSERVRLGIDVVEKKEQTAEMLYTLGGDAPGLVGEIRRRWRYG